MQEELFQVKLLAPNIAEVILKENVFLDIYVTDRIEAEIQKLAPGIKYYQMVIAHGPYVVDPEMRNAMTKDESGTKLLGIAWISPDEKANQEQEAIVSKLPIPMPIRFFSDREKGLTWLKSIASPK